jgi:organic hydroperoxide reductase OsmC/OhrA
MGVFADGRDGITEVVLHPRVSIAGGRQADDAAIAGLHHAAHERCTIAHSIRGEVRVEGSWHCTAGPQAAFD